MLVLDDLHAGAIGPDRKLLDCRRAKRVAGAEHDFLVHLSLQQPRELCDAGGLARAVHTGHENHRGASGRKLQVAVVVGKHPAQLITDDFFRIVAVLDFAEPPLLAHGRHKLFRAGRTHVGADELFFHLNDKRIVDLPARDEERSHVGVQHRRRFLQRAFELVECFGEETHAIKRRSDEATKRRRAGKTIDSIVVR